MFTIIYMNKIVFFTYNGKTPTIQWLLEQDPFTAARVRRAIQKMLDGNLGDCKILAPNLYETRLFFGGGYRIYYTIQNGQIIIILCAGDKKTQKRDIASAKKYLSIVQGGNYAQEK